MFELITFLKVLSDNTIIVTTGSRYIKKQKTLKLI